MIIAEKLVTVAENEQRVYEAGQKSEWSAFWDTYQENGARTTYSYCFSGYGWNKNTFKPKYDIRPKMASYMFAMNAISDLKRFLNECGVELDFSKCTDFPYAFQQSEITNIGVVDTTSASSLEYAFYRASKLKNIDKLILKSDGSQKFNNNYSFGQCSKLENMIVEGCIGMSFNVQASPLNVASIKSIIAALKDYSQTSKNLVYTVYFSNACWEALEADSEIPPNGSTWKDYVMSKGWNT